VTDLHLYIVQRASGNGGNVERHLERLAFHDRDRLWRNRTAGYRLLSLSFRCRSNHAICRLSASTRSA
jgi:hypothetical protein